MQAVKSGVVTWQVFLPQSLQAATRADSQSGRDSVCVCVCLLLLNGSIRDLQNTRFIHNSWRKIHDDKECAAGVQWSSAGPFSYDHHCWGSLSSKVSGGLNKKIKNFIADCFLTVATVQGCITPTRLIKKNERKKIGSISLLTSADVTSKLEKNITSAH